MATQKIGIDNVTSGKPSEVTFIVDLSGSVSYYVKDIGSKIFEATETMEARFYNVLYFSGKGQFGSLYNKYRKDSLPKDKFISKFNTIGMTYFKEALELFVESDANNKNSVMVFITDGEPTDGNIAAHDEACKKLALDIKANTLWVAVGNVNLDFFKDMSKITGGAIEHFDAMEDALSYVDAIKDARFTTIELPSGYDLFYEIVDGKQSIVNGNTVMTDTLYGVKLDKNSSSQEIAAAIKAGMFVEIEGSKYKKHIKFLLSQNLTSIARNNLANDIFNREVNLVVRPKVAKTTIFQLLNFLAENKVVIDRIKTFSGYKRNSKASGNSDDEGWAFDSMNEVSDVVYNKERLNVNIGMSFFGIKAVPNEKHYESKSAYKLYTIVQDSVIKVRKLFLDNNQAILNELERNNIPLEIQDSNIVVNLDNFPIISNSHVLDNEIPTLLTEVIMYEEFLKKARLAVKRMNPEEEKVEGYTPREKKVYTDSYEFEFLYLELEKDKAKELREKFEEDYSKVSDEYLIDQMKGVKGLLNNTRARLAEIRAICAVNHVVSWQGVNVVKGKKVIRI